MYPIDGYVYVKAVKSIWHDEQSKPEQGPFKILAHFILYEGSMHYYELECDSKFFFKYNELRPASEKEDLYDKMTQHLEEEFDELR